MYRIMVEQNEALYTYRALLNDNPKFFHCPLSHYVTDVTFQQANRRCGNLQEEKVYFSRNNTLYV